MKRKLRINYMSSCICLEYDTNIINELAEWILTNGKHTNRYNDGIDTFVFGNYLDFCDCIQEAFKLLTSGTS